MVRIYNGFMFIFYFIFLSLFPSLHFCFLKYSSLIHTGDVVGLFLDLDECRLWYHINDVFVGEYQYMQNLEGGLYPAVSFMSYQHARFNFGHEPFV